MNTNQGFWTEERLTGALLVAAILPLALGVYLFISRNGVQGGAPRSPALFVWERGSILAAVALTALGIVLLGAPLQGSNGRVLARLGASTYFFGAVLLAAAEAVRLPASYPLINISVTLAFLGQAAIGGALLQSNLLPAWIGWTTVVWNVGLLVILLNHHAGRHLLPHCPSPHAAADWHSFAVEDGWVMNMV
jgi:hypothetical protein